MARIRLCQPDASQDANTIWLEGAFQGGVARFDALRIPNSSDFVLPQPLQLPRAWLSPQNDDSEVFYALDPAAAGAAVAVEVSFTTTGTPFHFAGRKFDLQAGVLATLRLQLPIGTPDWERFPFAE